jgi:D-sedoheptulose 7-phosphate isomerase
MSNIQYAELVNSQLSEAQEVLKNFIADSSNIHKIVSAAELMANAIKGGNKIISCGNGGSHADAMHFAEELSGKFRNPRQSMAAMAISDPTHITCVGNDYGFNYIFSRFIEGLGNPGDVLLGISTSGNSANILEAVNAAEAKGMHIVLLTGKDGGKLAGKGTIEIRVPHFGYADRVQEIHIKVIHNLILLIEQMVASQNG